MKLKELFRVDGFKIGHDGDYSVGIRSEYSEINLSDEFAEILRDDNKVEDFKKELFELFKKYDNEVTEVFDDVEEDSCCIYEEISDMSYDEKVNMLQELEQEKASDTYGKMSKFHKEELAVLKEEVNEE